MDMTLFDSSLRLPRGTLLGLEWRPVRTRGAGWGSGWGLDRDRRDEDGLSELRGQGRLQAVACLPEPPEEAPSLLRAPSPLCTLRGASGFFSQETHSHEGSWGTGRLVTHSTWGGGACD